jgi:hypothetical protein
MSDERRTARSILVGSVIIAAAILFGAERVRSALLASRETATQTETGSRVSEPTETELRAQAAAGLEDRKLRLRDEGQTALAIRAPKYAAACGKAERKNELEPPFSNYRVVVQLDGSGRELSRTFEPSAPHAARDACVRSLQDEPLFVPGLGMPATIELSLAVP